VLDDSFTSIQQSLGVPRGLLAGGADDEALVVDFLNGFVEDAIATGRIAELIDVHGVTGRLSVAARVPMPRVELLHNPECSKSRMALELLRSRGVEPAIHEYEKLGMLVDTAESVLSKMPAGFEPSDLLRDAGDLEGADAARIARAVAAAPTTMQRPVAICGAKAVLGRPPENVLGVLP
jgi:arsenate reductase